MSFVIYHKETTRILRPRWYHPGYETEAAAKAALTRYEKNPQKARVGYGTTFKREDYVIATNADFAKIEKIVTKRNLMSGKEIQVRVNEPACTDPSTETYWSS